MQKIKKTYRLDSDLISDLEKYAQEKHMSQTEVLESAIRSAIQKPDTSHTQESGESDTTYDITWKELFMVEHEKLLALTDKVADSLQAAQTLQAMEKPALETTEQKEERKSRWRRLKEAWRG